MNQPEMQMMCGQLVALLNAGDEVSIRGRAGSGFEVTTHYWAIDGLTHFHAVGSTLPEAVDRAFTSRLKMWEVPQCPGATGEAVCKSPGSITADGVIALCRGLDRAEALLRQVHSERWLVGTDVGDAVSEYLAGSRPAPEVTK